MRTCKQFSETNSAPASAGPTSVGSEDIKPEDSKTKKVFNRIKKIFKKFNFLPSTPAEKLNKAQEKSIEDCSTDNKAYQHSISILNLDSDSDAATHSSFVSDVTGQNITPRHSSTPNEDIQQLKERLKKYYKDNPKKQIEEPKINNALTNFKSVGFDWRAMVEKYPSPENLTVLNHLRAQILEEINKKVLEHPEMNQALNDGFKLLLTEVKNNSEILNEDMLTPLEKEILKVIQGKVETSQESRKEQTISEVVKSYTKQLIEIQDFGSNNLTSDRDIAFTANSSSIQLEVDPKNRTVF